jgi:hypothetical protein
MNVKHTCAILLITLSVVGCDGNASTTSDPQVSTTSVATTSSDTSTSSSSTDGPTTSSTTRPDPSEGWGRLDVDTDVFGGVVPVDGATEDGRLVLVGCPSDGSTGFPVWWSEGGFDFERASGPEASGPQDVRCVQQVASTPFGWFAGGAGPLLRSSDGEEWDIVDVPGILGYEETFQLGYVDNLFASPDGERLTVLYRRAAMNESTIATFVTTTDGENWVENAHPSQSLFDSSGIAAVIEGGDGLLAAGASPGGEFVPTAAVFTSTDGLRWRRVTPTGGPDYDDKVIEDIAHIGDRFIAVGGDFFETGLMTAWVSPDGLQWRRVPNPPETTDPSVAHMTGQAITVADGYIWVSGRDFDARRSEPQSLPALWRSTDGEAWERIPLDDLEINVPFEITSSPDLRLAVWPPPSSLIDEPIVLYAAD